MSSCLLCPALTDPGFCACTPCYNRIRADLTEIGARFPALSAAPGRGGDRGRGAPGFGSRPPANLTTVALRDPRSSRRATTWHGADGRFHAEPEHPTLSPARELARVAVHVSTYRGLSARVPHDVAELVAFVDRHLSWLSGRPEIVEVARICSALVAQLRTATGEPGRVRIGSCPNFAVDGEPDEHGHVPECGAPLFAPIAGDVVECRRCHRRWSRPDWVLLGQRLVQTETGAA